MASLSITCICSALILHHDKVTITEDKINTIIKVVGVNMEPFWLGLFAKALTSIDIGSLICNMGVGGGAPATSVPTRGGTLTSRAAPAEEKKEEEKKEESEESDDDMGFGPFD